MAVDVANVHILYIGWDHRAKLAGFDLACHGGSRRPELNALAAF